MLHPRGSAHGGRRGRNREEARNGGEGTAAGRAGQTECEAEGRRRGRVALALMAPARAGPLTSSSVLHPYRCTTFSASFAAHVSNPPELPAEGASACFTAPAHPAV